MLGNVKPLLQEFLFLISFLTNYHSHLYAVHIAQYTTDFLAFLFCLCFISLFYQFFLFLCPVVLNLVVHLNSSVFIYTYHHTLSKETSSWEMVCYILGYLIQTIITLNNLEYSR